MKKILLIMLMFSILAFGKGALSNNCLYRLDLVDDAGKSITQYLGVNSRGGIYRAYSTGNSNIFYLSDNTQWISNTNDRVVSFTWMNAGGVWSEMQTYHIYRDDTIGKRRVTILRTVTNKNGSTFQVAYTGYVVYIRAI